LFGFLKYCWAKVSLKRLGESPSLLITQSPFTSTKAHEDLGTSSPLVSSVVLHFLYSFRVYFGIFSTRFECFLHLLHSFRVYFLVEIAMEAFQCPSICLSISHVMALYGGGQMTGEFPTRFECIFTSSPLV
jgi:hypothetical protein